VIVSVMKGHWRGLYFLLLCFVNDAHSVCAGGCCEGGGYSFIWTLLCMLWHVAKRKSLVAVSHCVTIVFNTG